MNLETLIPLGLTRRLFLIPALAGVLSLQMNEALAGTLLSTNFADQKAETTFQDSWSRLSGPEPTFESGKGLFLSETVVSFNLERPVVQEFSLQVELLHTKYAQGQWFGLFTSDFQKGVVVVWDASHPENWDSSGFACLYSINRTTEDKPPYMLILNGEGAERMSTPQGLPAKAGVSGQKAITEPFAKFRLTWNRTEGRLDLWMEDSLIGTAFLDQAEEFSEVVLSGMGGAIYRSVELSGE